MGLGYADSKLCGILPAVREEYELAPNVLGVVPIRLGGRRNLAEKRIGEDLGDFLKACPLRAHGSSRYHGAPVGFTPRAYRWPVIMR
jgi:hypothetical protein